MPMTPTSMANKIISKLDQLAPVQVEGSGDISGYRFEVWRAICEGIIEEITQNARAVGNDSDGDSHQLNIV